MLNFSPAVISPYYPPPGFIVTFQIGGALNLCLKFSAKILFQPIELSSEQYSTDLVLYNKTGGEIVPSKLPINHFDFSDKGVL